MRYQQLICISNDNRLILYKKYLGRKNYFNDDLYVIYDDKKGEIGSFPTRIFKPIKKLRKERLNNIL